MYRAYNLNIGCVRERLFSPCLMCLHWQPAVIVWICILFKTTPECHAFSWFPPIVFECDSINCLKLAWFVYILRKLLSKCLLICCSFSLWHTADQVVCCFTVCVKPGKPSIELRTDWQSYSEMDENNYEPYLLQSRDQIDKQMWLAASIDNMIDVRIILWHVQQISESFLSALPPWIHLDTQQGATINLEANNLYLKL